MKAEWRNTLPLATTSAFTPGTRLPQEKSAEWERALAQARQALRAAIPPSTVAASAFALPPLHPADLATSVQRCADRIPIGHGPACDPLAQGAAGELEGAASVHVRLAAVGRGFPAPGARIPSAERPASPMERPLPRSTASTPDPAAPIRIHVEQRPGGVAVWLGVDAQVGERRVAAIVQDLKQQSRGGFAVAALVCNGRLVFERASFSKETP